MKTPALPTRISSLFAFLWLLLLIALALLTLFGFLFTSQSHAATIVFGKVNTKDSRPFGITNTGTASYIGRYQQIYDAFYFFGGGLITQIAFMDSASTLTANNTYQLSIGLGVTARTPGDPGSGFATGATPAFSGSLVGHITPAAGDFDMLIPLSTPFFYDPTQGDLLLDVTVLSAGGQSGSGAGTVFTVEDSSKLMGRIVDSGGSALPLKYSGLVTQFTVTPAPEPATAVLLCAGVALCVSRRRRVERAWR